MRRLAYFGGTFDPPHVGHLIVARGVVEALELDALFFLPARIPPHKLDAPVSPAGVRLEMLRAAVDGDPVLAISELELEREGPSWTVETLRELTARLPDDEIHFVIGTDQLAELDTWREPEEIADLARLVVITREGAGGGASGHGPASRTSSGAWGHGPARAGAEIRAPVDVPYDLVPVTRVDVSSTGIRERVRDGRSIRYLVPEPVRRIIEREALYI